MTRFNTKIAAGVAGLLGASYLVAGLASGHSARSEPPPDLTANAAEAGLDAWKAAAALLDGSGKAMVIDLRSPEEYARYHVPGSISEPGATAARLVELARDHAPIVVVAAKDDAAQKLVGEARASAKDAKIHYLVDGPRAWYLAFELPVPLFAEASVPRDYEQALGALRGFLARPDPAAKSAALEALQTLAKINFQPTLLKQSGKPKAAGGAKKKISGGCG
jgi:rhodanese-related sulfurtransferase